MEQQSISIVGAQGKTPEETIKEMIVEAGYEIIPQRVVNIIDGGLVDGVLAKLDLSSSSFFCMGEDGGGYGWYCRGRRSLCVLCVLLAYFYYGN